MWAQARGNHRESIATRWRHPAGTPPCGISWCSAPSLPWSVAHSWSVGRTLQDDAVIIVEVRWPGSWIGGSLDQSAAHDATSLLHMMESRLFEAAIALDMFEQARVADWSRHQADQETRHADWMREGEELRRIVEALRGHLSHGLSPEELWEAERGLYDEARRLHQHQKWEAGEVPGQYLQCVPLMHARSYLTALDSIAQTVDQMIGEGWEPFALSEVARSWESKVPNVRAVRNTVAHESERAMRRRQGGKPIALQPIENGFVSAPGGGVLILNSLDGNRFGCTMADGHYGEVEVSVDSLVATTELVQGALDSFTWTGPVHWSPSS